MFMKMKVASILAFKGFDCPYVNKTKRGNVCVNLSGAIPLLPLPPIFLHGVDGETTVLLPLRSLKNIYMFTRTHDWTLYFPRQFSPIHAPLCTAPI
jgi:hypothetical protein